MTYAHPDDGAYAHQMSRILGRPAMAVFQAADTTELYVNPDGALWRIVRGHGHEPTGLRLGPGDVEAFLNVAAARLGEAITADAPSVQGELPDAYFGGARLQGLLPPVAPAPLFNLRKGPGAPVPLTELEVEGLLTARERGVLEAALAAGETVVVAGPTGAGKTHFLNALIETQARLLGRERVRLLILEDTAELCLTAPNAVHLRFSPSFPLEALVSVTLRMTPERLHVGEVRTPAALAMMQAWKTGHPGCCTVHGARAEDALQWLAYLASRASGRDESWLVASAVQWVAVLALTREGRRLRELVRCTGHRAGRFRLTAA